VDAEGGLEMVVVVGFHGTDETDVIHTSGDVGEEVGDLGPAFSARRGLPPALEEFIFSMELFEFGFGVEGIDVRDAAGHEHEDDAFGPGGEVGYFGSERIDGFFYDTGGGAKLLENGRKD